jgi:hypothetical protein
MKLEFNSPNDCLDKDLYNRQDQHLFTTIVEGTLSKQRSMAGEKALSSKYQAITLYFKARAEKRNEKNFLVRSVKLQAKILFPNFLTRQTKGMHNFLPMISACSKKVDSNRSKLFNCQFIRYNLHNLVPYF